MISLKEMNYLESNCDLSIRQLMENSGYQAYLKIKEKISLRNKRVLIVCGHGNNGGDGFVLARYLKNDCDVKILFIGNLEKFSDETRGNHEKIRDLITKDENLINSSDILVDAMIGTGFKKELKEPYLGVIKKFNQADAFKVSIDVPSGFDLSKKDNRGFVDSDLIIVMHDLKEGMELLLDNCVIVSIGIKKE